MRTFTTFPALYVLRLVLHIIVLHLMQLFPAIKRTADAPRPRKQHDTGLERDKPHRAENTVSN